MTREELLAKLQGMDDRTRMRLGLGLAAILLIVVVLTVVNGRISALDKKRLARETDIAELMKLKVRYQEASGAAQRQTNRLLATRADDTPAKIIDEIGIKGRNAQIKPVKGEELPGFTEDAADVKIEGLSANEAANLIFRLEKGARPVVIKKALIKQRFDDPSKLDLALTIALIRQGPAGAR